MSVDTIEEIKRNCPKCKKMLRYGCEGSLCRAIKNKSVCSSCIKKGKKRSKEIKQIKYIEEKKLNSGQLHPNYSVEGCKIIDEFGEKHGYNFQHAENGGEFHIKELGYFVDGYDVDQNVVIEVDESHHYKNGELKKKDKGRQKEIVEYLGCKFIRIRI